MINFNNGGDMQCSFDSNKKSGRFLNFLFWLPFLFLEAGDDCGDEYNKECCVFMALGTAVPIFLLFLSAKFDWRILILEIKTSNVFLSLALTGWWLGIILFLITYLMVGLLARFSIKSNWGGRIL